MSKLKILLIGPERAGKTTLANALADPTRESLPTYRPTVGVRILDCESTVFVGGRPEKVEYSLWDLSGDLKFEATWPVSQADADGVMIISNGDLPLKTEELEAWVKSFPKRMRLSPQQCIGLANHPSGVIPPDSAPFSVLSVGFTHCCFEEKVETIEQPVARFLAKVLEKKK